MSAQNQLPATEVCLTDTGVIYQRISSEAALCDCGCEEELAYSVVCEPRIPFRLCLEVAIHVSEHIQVGHDHRLELTILLRCSAQITQAP